MESILLIFIALGEDLVHFPQGSKLWLGGCFGKSHNILYKLNHDEYETLKIPLHIPSLCSEIQVTLGSFGKPFPTITQGELEPQFASKGSYFEQNNKQVCRRNWEDKKHTWAWYLIYIMIHASSEKIWKHLRQYGGLDIKTS